MILTDPNGYILKFSGRYLHFWLIYKDLLKLGDHGHVRSWLGEVRLDQVRVSVLGGQKGHL